MKQDISIPGVTRIALPLVVSGLAIHLVGVVDIIFVGHLGEAQLGGTGNGQVLYAFMTLIGMGFTTGMQIIIGRRNGEGNYHLIGPVFQQGMYFSLGLGATLAFFIFTIFPKLLPFVFESPEVVTFTTDYIVYRGWAMIFTMFNLLFISFYVGITQTRIIGWFTGSLSVINILLDYLLIYGHWGLPAMGVKGAALASAIASVIGSLLFLIYTLKYIRWNKYRLFEFVPLSLKKINDILRISAPVMAQNAVSLGGWFVFFIFVERLGERSLAISQVIRSIYILIMVPVFALGDATNTLVSNLIGSNRLKEVVPLIWKVSALGLVLNGVFFVLLNLFPEQTIGIFSPQPDFIADAIPTLRVTTFSMFMFTIGLVSFRAVTGTGNTQISLWIELLCVGFYLLYVWFFTVHQPSELYVVWLSEFVYFGLLFILSYSFMHFRDWHKKQV